MNKTVLTSRSLSTSKQLHWKSCVIKDKMFVNCVIEEGFSQSYIDFFYITNHNIPEVIDPSPQYKNNMEKNRDKRKLYGEMEEELSDLKRDLTRAEACMR